jgi:catechol 2,3-dioxygenase-like lactoylglutathione lyase family enzyme
MKRFHVHVSVDDLERSVRFYSTVFAATPTVRKADYAKWMLDDPRVNFAISARGRATTGVDHLGIQVEDETELHAVFDRLKAAEAPLYEQGKTTCCYAEGEKSWVLDPQGVSWEAFLTSGESTVYGDSVSREALEAACCDKPVPAADPASSGCDSAASAPIAAACCEPAASA